LKKGFFKLSGQISIKVKELGILPINKTAVLFSVYYTFLILCLYNPVKDVTVNSFERILGNGILYGVDIEKRISNAYRWYLIIGPVIFMSIYSVVSYLLKKFSTNSFSNLKKIIFIYIPFTIIPSILFKNKIPTVVNTFKKVNNFVNHTIISNYKFKYLILLVVIFIIAIYGIKYLHNKWHNTDNDEIVVFVKSVITASVLFLLAEVVNYVLNKNKLANSISHMLSYSVLLSFSVIVLALIFIALKKYLSITFNVYKWIVFVVLPLAVSILFILGSKGSLKIIFVVFYIIIVSFITLLVSWLVRANKLNEEKINKLQIAFTPVMYSLFLVSLFIELVNILNQYNVFITQKVLYSTIIIVGFIILAICSFVFGKGNPKFKWEKHYYPGIILSFSSIMVQPYFQTVVTTDLFESANHGLTVYEFLKNGKIPLIETFDAHMMANSIGGIIFGLLNNDVIGGMLNTSEGYIIYGGYVIPILYLLFYKLIKTCFNENFALFMALLIPLSVRVTYVDFAFISIFALIFGMRKNNFWGYLVYWLSLVLICVNRLDTGFSFSIGTVMTFFTIRFLRKESLKLKQFGTSLIAVLSSFFALYIFICQIKGINGLLRLKEILSLSLSNVNWAYASLGEKNSYLAYVFCYHVMPFVVIGILFLLIYLIKNENIKISNANLTILLVLFFAYIANISRGMVRHSVNEMHLQTVLSTSVLFLALTAATMVKRFKPETFLIVFLSFVIFVGVLSKSIDINTDTLVNASLNKLSDEKLFNDNPTKKTDRIIISNAMKDEYKDVVQMIKAVMKNDETYLDFTNQSLLYALSDKQKPVYVNQSPGILSGEFTQEQFIKQVEKNKEKVAFALMPAQADGKPALHSLDDIPNPYRYYKVSEYISQNYKPLIKVDKYVLWCRSEKYNEVYNSLLNSNMKPNTSEQRTLYGMLSDYNYSELKVLHTYNLNQIPYVWGMYDVKKSYNNTVIEGAITKRDNFYDIDIKNISKEKGNYIMIEADSKTAGNFSISFGNRNSVKFLDLNNFNFKINQGEKNRYIIRVSSDFYWYSGEINAFKVKSDIPLENLSIKLLKGD
jgi:hypothetical protein